MSEKPAKGSLLDLLRGVSDPRSRHGRIYPLYGLLAVLILAAMHGENSLLGMWQWAKEREEQLVNYMPLGLWARPHIPSLATFWQVLRKLDAGALEQAIGSWVQGWQGEVAYALDGKALRGSKRRAGERALRALTMAGQVLQGIIAAREVEEGNELAAALALLEEVPLKGKVVSADAGLLQATFVQKVVEKRGPTLASSRTTTPG
jgi:hypothetical protein